MDLLTDLLDTRVTAEQAATFSAIALAAFTFLLVLSHARLDVRILRYLREDVRVPELARRDWWYQTGLSIPFVGIFAARAFSVMGLGTNLWWLLVTTLGAVGAMAVWAWYEFFVIERLDD